MSSREAEIQRRMALSESRVVKTVFPFTTNHHNTLFGGTALAWMDEVSFVTATRFCRLPLVTVSSDRIDFKYPIAAGSIVELIGRVIRVGNTSLKVEVEVFVEEGERPGRRVRERRRNRAPGFLPPLREFPDAVDGPDRTGIHAPDVREKVLEFLRLFGRDAEFRRRGRRFLAPERVGAPFERFGAFPQGRFDRGEPRFGQVVGKRRRGRGAAEDEREQDARKQQAEGTPPSRVAVRGAPSA